MFNDKIGDHSGRKHKFKISGMGVDKDPMGLFSIEETTGMVYVHEPIDREQHDLFHVRQTTSRN